MEVPRHWRLRPQRYRLEGSLCLICGKYSFLPHPACPHCTTQGRGSPAAEARDSRHRLLSVTSSRA